MPLRHLLFLFLFASPLFAQDSSTGAIRGTVRDPAGAVIAAAEVRLTEESNHMSRRALTGPDGAFAFDFLPPGNYTVEISAPGMAAYKQTGVHVEVGGVAQINASLKIAAANTTVTVTSGAATVETENASVSDVIDTKAIESLPLNGRRFTDLTLLTTGVTLDPRGLTSSTNGDLSFGGVRGYHTQFMVDGADNNNSFFAQARGRYRAPYQFSNEVIQEFRVSSNTYGAEQGRSAGAVMNVVTRSGSNATHGGVFYYYRDGRTAATHPFVRKRYPDKQHQFGATLGGPIVRNKVFYFAGFDQNVFHVPTVVQFANGSSLAVPSPADYEFNDQALVYATAAQLSQAAGTYRTDLLGTTGFLKTDFVLSQKHLLSARVNISRFHGANNVFFDAFSPITHSALTQNGEEIVGTESLTVSLTSVVTPRWTSHLRAQFSRDNQASSANSAAAAVTINDWLSGSGRSSILPRQTNEHRWQLADSLSWTNARHTLKIGGDLILTRLDNYFPQLFGGSYIFDTIRVNPFTFAPQTFGLPLTPLRAYAHQVPRRYIQNFGTSESRPDTNEYAAFIQDTVRVGNRLALSFGLRYDLQTFRSDRLTPNPLWPGSGKVPRDRNNFSPRIGFALRVLGVDRPIVLRGGFGIFYGRIPSIYNSAVETDNGLNQQHISLDNSDFFQRQIFPSYPAPLAVCPPGTKVCPAPASVAGFLTTQISAFAQDFQVPYTEQASITAEREVLHRTSIGIGYLYVAGRHLIRARDANLPQPVIEDYPVFDDTGTNFTGRFLPVESFSTWQFAPSLTCPFPPCINPLARPISNVGAITVFESAASSTYHGVTFSAKRRLTDGLYFRLGYTWAQAVDDTQDSLVSSQPSQVQNTFDPKAEKGRSTTDQRNRFVLAFVADPKPFSREHAAAQKVFNGWTLSGVFSFGSGRPLTAQVSGDANRDGNFSNDRLPGAARNSFAGPDYASMDFRLMRRFTLTRDRRWRLEAAAEAFNLFNRDNKRVTTNDQGSTSAAANFVPFTVTVNGIKYPGSLQQNTTFLRPNNAYAPRQLQFYLRLKF